MSAPGRPAHYEIRVDSVLDGRWEAWFDGLQVSIEGEETVISGLIPDQAALHGLLAKVRDLGLCLTSVRRLNPARPSHPPGQLGTAAVAPSRRHDQQEKP